MQTQVDRIVMIDDQVAFVDAFGLALSMTEDLRLVGRASTAGEGIDLCTTHKPDLVITDYRLPDGRTGSKVASELRSDGFSAPIIVLTGFLAPQVKREVEALSGVTAISKDASIQSIVTMMRSTILGESAIDLRAEASTEELATESFGLSSAELEVLEALNTGATPNEISESLFLSVHTVRGRIKAVYRKLGVGSLGEAIAKATREGVLVPPT